MKSIHTSYTWAMAALVLLLVAGIGLMPVCAQEPSAPPQTATPKAPESGENKAQKYFTDTVLINQNGERMRFYTDLMKDKTVIIDTFFATCQASCLPLNRNLAQIQEALGDRLGKDAHILSISVDPTVDTPTLLKAYAKKLNARPGWYFLTGDKENVELILKKLGQFVEDKNGHLNLFLIGNDRTGLWKKAFGLAKSEELMKVVNSVLNDPGAAAKP
jgi:protein SCO1